MKDFRHSNSQLLLCNKPLPECSQLLLSWGGEWEGGRALPGCCAVRQLCLLLQVLEQLDGSAPQPLLLLGPVGWPGVLFTPFPRHRLGTGILSLPKRVLCGAAHCPW